MISRSGGDQACGASMNAGTTDSGAVDEGSVDGALSNSTDAAAISKDMVTTTGTSTHSGE
jgi:hypothetical protein